MSALVRLALGLACVLICSRGWTAPYQMDAIADNRPGAIPACTDCAPTTAAFFTLLDTVRQAQLQGPPNIAALPQQDDFLVARTGTLIHKNCFAAGRWKFNIEEAEVDSTAKGMSCLARGERVYGETGRGWTTSTRHSLFPRFIQYMDQSKWNARITPYSYLANGNKVEFGSCAFLRKFPHFKESLRDDCDVIERYGNRPKIFCEEDEANKYRAKMESNRWKRLSQATNHAYATVGSRDPIVVNFEGKTRVYNGPAIILKKNRHTQNWQKGDLESVIFHERIHNLGFIHRGAMPEDHAGKAVQLHNDYTVACQAACFGNVHGQALTAEQYRFSEQTCFAMAVNADDSANAMIGDIRSSIWKQQNGLYYGGWRIVAVASQVQSFNDPWHRFH